jgi:D,D-heptose 1,7-bisphosphate phosphatase
VGTLDRHALVQSDILSGKVAKLNLVNSRAAIFLDRDGVLNVEKGDRMTADEVQLLPGTAAAIRKINRSGYLAICVTNQPGVAKGFLDERDVESCMAAIDTLLGAERAYLDDTFICPHYPERGFAGERLELKIDCNCRKPKPGLLLKAAERYNVDLTRSYFIGDRTVDIEAGIRAGVHAVLVRTGFAGADGKSSAVAESIAEDLNSAVDAILEGHQ